MFYVLTESALTLRCSRAVLWGNAFVDQRRQHQTFFDGLADSVP